MNHSTSPPETEPAPESTEETITDSTERQNQVGCLAATGESLLACFRFFGHCLLIGCGFQLIVGTFLRLTFRDTIPHLAVFFYISPPILLTASATVLFIRKLFLGQKRWALSFLGIMLITTGWWWIGFYQWPTEQPATAATSSTHKFVFWNIRYARAGWPAIADELVEIKAVCECGSKSTMNMRVDEAGNPVLAGQQTAIGGNELYVALCRKHFMEKLNG